MLKLYANKFKDSLLIKKILQITAVHNYKINNKSILLAQVYKVGKFSLLKNTRIITQDIIEILVFPEVLVVKNFKKEIDLHFQVTSNQHS